MSRLPILFLLAVLLLGSTFEAAGQTAGRRTAGPVPPTTAAIEPSAHMPEADILAPSWRLPAKHGPRDVSTLYENTLDLVRRQAWDAVERRLLHLRESPHAKNWNHRSRLLLAYAAIRQGRDAEAVRWLEPSTSKFGNLSFDLHYMAAEAYFRLQNYPAARRHYRRISNLPADWSVNADPQLWERPHLFDAQVKELDCLLAMKHADTVIYRSIQFEKRYSEFWSTSHPLVDDLRWARARAYRQKGDLKHEIAVLRRINRFVPNSRGNGKLRNRIVQLEAEGLSFDPEDGPALTALADQLRRIYANEESLALIERAERRLAARTLDLDLDSLHELAVTKARVYFNLQRYDDALAVLDALNRSPDLPPKRGPQVRKLIAKAFGRLNRLEEASRQYTALAQELNNSEKVEAEFMAGWLLGHLPQRFDDAERLLAQVMRDNPRSPFARKALWFRGWFAFRVGRYDEALARFRELRKQNGGSAYAHACLYWIGRIHHIQGELGRAKSYYVHLAGSGLFNYYRLAALSRLHEMTTPDTLHAVPGDLQPVKLDAVAAEPVADAEVNRLHKQRDEAWQTELAAAENRPPYSLTDLRRGFAERQIELTDRWNRLSRGRDRRLRSDAEQLETLLPDLRRALAWQRLGLTEESRQAFKRLLDHIETAQRPNRAHPDITLKLGEDRLAALDQLPGKVFFDLIGAALGNADNAAAFRLFTRFLDSRERQRIAWETRRRMWYPAAYPDSVKTWAEAYDVPDDFVLSIMRTESHFSPLAESYMSARGLMQIMPHTGDRIAAAMPDPGFNRARLFDRETSIQYGTWYLGQLLVKFQRQIPLAAAAYNGGPHNVETWLERYPTQEWDEFIESIEFKQTREYVKKVLRTMAAYRFLYTGEFAAWPLSRPVDPHTGDNIDF